MTWEQLLYQKHFVSLHRQNGKHTLGFIVLSSVKAKLRDYKFDLRCMWFKRMLLTENTR